MEILDKESNAYLYSIIKTPTPSGFEKKGQAIFISYAKKYADSVTMDTIGNVIALKKGKSSDFKIMVSAHIDEVGFMVKYIDSIGMVYIAPIGGVDLSLLPGLQLILQHNDERHVAVVGRKPIHLLNEVERKNIDVDSVWVDLGFGSKEEALRVISVGDILTYSSNLTKVYGDKVTSHSVDNKIGGVIMLEAMKRLTTQLPPYDTYFVSTVQEEIGLRGVSIAASIIKPNIALVIDAAHATDYPSAILTKHGDIRLGDGPVIYKSPDTDDQIEHKLCDIAKANGIKYQIEACPNGTNTETRSLQVANNGIRTGLISFPVRYMHSPIEMFSTTDIDRTIKLVAIFCSTNHDDIILINSND